MEPSNHPLAELERACPAGAREGDASDLVDGTVPHFVASATNANEVAAALGVAQRHGLPVVARGAGSKQDWGAPPQRVGLLLDLSKMAGVVEHVSGDLVVTVKVGTPLAQLSAALSAAGQRLTVDELVPGSTIGGIVATGASGPLRYGYGAVRDLVLGVTVVRADGAIAKAGGKVVKNVAGYDLPKLFTGSYGTLGVITELTFKLRPVPTSSLFVSALYEGPALAGTSLAAMVRSQAAPAAIEIERASPCSPIEVCALVEGREAAVATRARQLARLMPGATVSPLPPTWWGQLPGEVTFKLTSVLSGVPRLVARVGDACAGLGLPGRLSGSAGAGVLFLGLPGGAPPSQLNSLLQDLRREARNVEGYVTVLRAPARSKPGLDIWGPVPGLELMRRVKQCFDPGRLLAPGRFVGGI